MREGRTFSFIVGLLALSPSVVHAHSVRSDLDLKFYEIKSYNEPPEYLGFTSSKVDNFVNIPYGDGWFVRPDGRMSEESYAKLLNELRTKHFPGLDVSDRWDVTNQTLSALEGLTSLCILRLANTRINDNGLRVLDQLPGLKVLVLNNQITDIGLRRVGSLPHLEALDLQKAKITNGGLAVLKDLPRLEMLDISGTHVTDAGAKTLATLTSLKQLDVSGTDITDKGMMLLAGLPHLETLYVSGHLTNHGLQAIAGLKHLRNLDLSGAHITDAGVSMLIRATHLQALALSDTRVGDSALDYVAQMKTLKVLELSDTGVTREGLAALSGMPHLETLSLSWGELSSSELESLGGLPHLSRVILNGRTLSSDLLNRIRALAKSNQPKPSQTAALEHRTMPGVAPTSHPGRSQEPFVVMKQSVPPNAPRLRPGGDVVRNASLPPDLASSPPVKSDIALDAAPKGKGMMIEVGAAPAAHTGTALTGLKRIYQAELLQKSHDPDLAAGESQEIHSPQETAANSLGEIEVNSTHATH